MAVEAVRIDGRRLGASFRTLSVHEARALLLYGIERRRPVQLVVGRAGSGKSRLLGALSRTAVPGADLVLARSLPESFEEITVMLAERFGVSRVPGESPLERLVRLAEVLAERRRAGRLVALLLDDVHTLPATALRDLRLLAGTDAEGGALLPLVVAGRPELATAVGEPALEPFRLAISTCIELRRPLPATVEEVADPDDSLPRDRRRPPWRLWAGGSLLGSLLVALIVLLARAPSPPPPVRVAPVPSIPAHDTEGAPVQELVSAPPALPESPPLLPAEGITSAAVRAIVHEFSAALTAHDLPRLERILARDVRQNGVRGRGPILESYAYRFARLEAPLALDAPARITLRGATALVDVPFASPYRDAGGNVGSVDGTLRLRVVRHGGRLVLDSLDWAFADGTP